MARYNSLFGISAVYVDYKKNKNEKKTVGGECLGSPAAEHNNYRQFFQ